MTRRLWPVLGVAVVGAALAWGGSQAVRSRTELLDASDATAATTARELADRDTQIVVWRRALAQDPGSAVVTAQLAGLHLQRSRESGSWRDVLEAERLARASWSRRRAHNTAAGATLVAALVAQHRFEAADTVARALVAFAPETPEYHAILAEVAMERGDDSLAAAEVARVGPARARLSIAPRVARWHELRGDLRTARRLLRQSRDSAAGRFGLAPEVQAWYALRLGEFERRADRPHRAEAAFRDGLRVRPGDPRLLAAMTRLAADRGKDVDVIAWGERAIGASVDPEVLLLLASAYERHCDSAAAADARAGFDAATARLRDAPFHRAWSLLLLDRAEGVDEQLARARKEVTIRRDVYAYDWLAWAEFKSGNVAAARVAIAEATRLGTPDPLIARHREAIMRARETDSR